MQAVNRMTKNHYFEETTKSFKTIKEKKVEDSG